ncbi:Kef-type K+ transport system membrane component KefB [Deinobacterium chartae]|uniref:Kef-type K+ transport system membrane component KefB n=1 Tax=Deinobacterium chartae TaxID=521158 RepID=A0A841I2Q1_9DEIO|nr:cation:proton antiporter [Deinobacterium chartae]MBB6099284.1 Kef-type K+ transport system membrane component KefB [Deinobacterium chartae]
MTWLHASVLLTFVFGGQALAAAEAETGGILLQLFYLIAAAVVGGWLFSRLRLPAVVGQVLAGVVVGPSVLGVALPSDFNRALAELGAIFLLFMVGLETRFSDLLKVGKEALIVAVLGIAFPMIGGYIFGAFQGYDSIVALFIGTALVATSVGITAKVLQEMGVLNTVYAQIILGAAVIDDILGLTILAVVSGLGAGEGFSGSKLLSTLGLSIGFVVAVLALGIPLLTRIRPALKRVALGNSFGVVLAVGLGLAGLAAQAGLAPIIGAFLAGMVLSEVKDEYDFENKVRAIEAFLAPIFFAVVGMQLNLALLGSGPVLIGGLLLSAIAVLGKLIGGYLGALSRGKRDAVVVGVGMVPRGEVGLIVANIGLGLGVVTQTVYAEVLLMVMVTTLVAPIALRALVPAPPVASGVKT